MLDNIEAVIQSTKSKNFAQTEFAIKSGPGTDMLSKNGKASISYYKVFQQPLADGDSAQNIMKETQALKQKKLLQSLSFVPDNVFNEKVLKNMQQRDIEELGRIAAEGKQQLIINKLEGMIDNQIHKDILEAQPGTRADSQLSKNKKDEDMAKTQSLSQVDNDYLQEQIDLYANKIKAKVGQQHSFNSIQRTDKNILRRFYGEQVSQGPIYRPNYNQVWTYKNSHVSMKEKLTEPRQKNMDILMPECLKRGENTCTYEIRKTIRDANKPPESPDDTKRSKRNSKSNEQALAQRRSKIDIYDPKKLPMKMIPEEQRYENKRIGRNNVSFSLQKSRDENIMLTNPFPGDDRFQKANAHDSRFESVNVTLDNVSAHNRSLIIPSMQTQSSRKELFIKKEDLALPDTNIYQTTQYGKTSKWNDADKKLGAMKFQQRPYRQFNYDTRKFKIPESYDKDKLEHAYNHTSSTKKIKGHVQFSNQIERDCSMYNIDKKEFKSIELELNRSPLNFNDYIPNSLKPLKRPDSRHSYSTTNVSMNHTNTQQLDSSTMKSHKGALSTSNFMRERFSSISNSKDRVFDYTNSRRENSTINPKLSHDLSRVISLQRLGNLNTSNSGIMRNGIDPGQNLTPAMHSLGQFSQTPMLQNLDNLNDISTFTNLQNPNMNSLRSIQLDNMTADALKNEGFQQNITPLTMRMARNLGNRAQSERSTTDISKAEKKNMIQQKKLVNVNGSFLQFDEGSKKLLDVSKKIIKNPHSMITGENSGYLAINEKKTTAQSKI